MNKVKRVALIGAGKLTDTPLTRFGGLRDWLGPVKASSFRVASRFVNHLRCGHPVREYSDLDACRLILISVPDAILPAMLGEWLASGGSLRGKAVVLCSALRDSSDLRELSSLGAAVGSISLIPGFEESRYLVEGDKAAIREARRLVEHGEKRAITIERSLKPFFLASGTFTGSLLFALLLAAEKSLRHAGIPADLSPLILEKQLGKTLRSYVKAGRKGYLESKELPKQLHALAQADPQLAHYLEQSCRLAAGLMEPW